MARCTGGARHGARHWFTIYGRPGLRTPLCVRCGEPNPRPLTSEQAEALRYWLLNDARVGPISQRMLALVGGARSSRLTR